jgi:GTP pyrophosphokinase
MAVKPDPNDSLAVSGRPGAELLMKDREMQYLRSIYLAPYMQLATALIGKSRHSGGNMFRHQIDTLGILIDYGYIEGVLLKAACIHDVLEDVPGFDAHQILAIDSESPQVLELVREVTKPEGQLKSEYLRGIIARGSTRAKVLKCADRISNMISLGFVTNQAFIERYCDETEYYVFPLALEVNYSMYEELMSLVFARRRFLETTGYFDNHD